VRTLLFASIAGVALLGTSEPTLAQNGTTVCRPGGRCVLTSAAVYNRCVDRALQSGQDLSRGDRHSFDRFVFDCVAGRTR
jgi:hypothetical protein